jgi:glycosyltransferase involved in cell wall biosynthesis
MAHPLVSVIIPNYNYARFVGAAIDSVLGQTYPNLEVIVVNNGSTDNSLEVLKAYGDRIRLIDQANKGQSEARNSGIAVARGEFIALLDADDVWVREKLEKQMALFTRPEVGLVYSGLTVADVDLQPIRVLTPHLQGRLLREFAIGPGAVILGGESTSVIRKECFDRIGTWDPILSISAGWDVYRRIASEYEVGLVPESLMLYRQHDANASSHIDIYEHDVAIKLRKMFSDPRSTEVWPLRRVCYGRASLAVSGSYLHAGKPMDSLRCLAKAGFYWPPALKYALKAPWRAIQRRVTRA